MEQIYRAYHNPTEMHREWQYIFAALYICILLLTLCWLCVLHKGDKDYSQNIPKQMRINKDETEWVKCYPQTHNTEDIDGFLVLN